MHWKPVLVGIFRDAREFPGWEAIRSNHDEEDQAFFETLEELYGNGKIKTLKPSEDPENKRFAQKELEELEAEWKIQKFYER